MAGTWLSPEAKAIKQFAQRLLLDRRGIESLPFMIPLDWDLPNVGGGVNVAQGGCTLLGVDGKSYMLKLFAQKGTNRVWEIIGWKICDMKGDTIMSDLKKAFNRIYGQVRRERNDYDPYWHREAYLAKLTGSDEKLRAVAEAAVTLRQSLKAPIILRGEEGRFDTTTHLEGEIAERIVTWQGHELIQKVFVTTGYDENVRVKTRHGRGRGAWVLKPQWYTVIVYSDKPGRAFFVEVVVSVKDGDYQIICDYGADYSWRYTSLRDLRERTKYFHEHASRLTKRVVLDQWTKDTILRYENRWSHLRPSKVE